jgi:hypothetical protein
MISALRQVTSPENLLAAPRLRSPRPLESFATATGGVALGVSWEPVAGARTYRLEIAGDRLFDRTVVDRDEILVTAAQSPALSEGVYHVRVAGVDAQGRLGDFSDPVPVRIVLDRVPPFVEVQKCLVVRSGRGREVLVSGRTEPNAAVLVSGRPIAVDAIGYFSAVLRDVPGGQREIEVTARDRAGNVTTVKQAIQA